MSINGISWLRGTPQLMPEPLDVGVVSKASPTDLKAERERAVRLLLLAGWAMYSARVGTGS